MDTVIDTRSVRVVRVFDAPRERVFDAWIDAEQFKAWMCPPGSGLDRCELGPVMVVYPNETWYTYVDEHDIDEIVESHLKNGQVVERLKI